MLKFFNKIRKQLLNDNQTGRYLKYAIGEIILVMIGILLALQVSNWNNNRELEKEELKVLKSLLQEFKENLARFDVAYKFHLNRKKAIEAMMTSDPRELSLDSLRNLNRSINNNYTFDPFQGIYNSVINSGKIELVSNDSLKIKIAIIQDLLNDYKEEETNAMVFTQRNLYPFQIDSSKIDFSIYYSTKEHSEDELMEFKQNLLQVLESNKYENLLVYIHGYMNGIFIEGPILEEEMVSIINLLESEIEKHEN
ncbi:DUF6090 family protein [Hanstruepera marina]|uniref:DUF6090 family protein n=1 Tax=Hanstruepera marina TaxID=2873265 RepID=UPI001CA5F6C8|nr:DUF6090 family protein [Hanstruepera marina]